jgi:RNA polymerase sigma-70 factor, ECF subfamily
MHRAETDPRENVRIVAALRQRDEGALAQVYDRYGQAVYGLALRITGDTGAAEEISLDAFWHLWQHAERYDPTQGSLLNWLFTIARSRAIDRVRARGAQKRVHAEDPTDVNHVRPAEELVEVVEQRRLVREAMQALSPEQRAALSLAYYEGLSHSQIAARLQEPLGTVKTRIRQAMLVLRRALEPALTVRSER